MAATVFKKTQPQICQALTEKLTQDGIYWKNLAFPIVVKQNAAVSYIEFSPVEPYNYAVTSSTKVQIFCHRANQSIRALTRFHQTAYSGSYRSDGQLLVAGSDEPVVRIFATKKVLRELKGHTRSVHVTRFTRDNQRVFSGSDDQTVKLWDVSSEQEVSSFLEHQDYIRCGAASPISSDIIVTGSYDHTVKLFDVRTTTSVLTVNHGHPVESVLFYPSGGLFVSAGGNVVKVWDALAGGRQLAQFTNHHKTVTSLCFASNFRRLVSASLDRHVKFIDVGTYQVVHTLDFPSAILSVAISPSDDMLTVGMADGLLSIQHRRDDEEMSALEREKRKRKRKLTSISLPMHYYSAKPDKDDQVVKHDRKAFLEKYDLYLKKFQYTKAFDAAMDVRVRTKSPDVTVSVIRELIRRDALRQSLAGREDESVARIVNFILKNICQPQYINTLLDVLVILIELYRDRADVMACTREIMTQLHRTVDVSIDVALSKAGSIAMCDLILASSTALTANISGLTTEQKLVETEINAEEMDITATTT